MSQKKNENIYIDANNLYGLCLKFFQQVDSNG